MQVTDINKLGKELEIYTYADYVGKGFPIILPNGTKIINIIKNYIENEEEKNGYEKVMTPNVSKAEIYIKEDRFESQKDDMFIIKNDEEEKNSIVLRPYTYPFHCAIYKINQKSYKSLPIKLSETSSVFRDERDIKGISKTRQMTISDASIFLAKEDLEKELVQALRLQINILSKLGLQVKFQVKTWDDLKKEEYIGTIEEWEYATKAMKNALEKMNIKYQEKNDAKMYGPSINILYEDEELSNIQIDFEIVHRFDLTYANKDNEESYPIYIHKTTIPSYENLLSILIEKYKGELPIWLAPTQVMIIPDGEEYEDYAKEIENKLLEYKIRAKIDLSNNSIQNREQKAESLKIPYIVKIEKKEYNNKNIKVKYKQSEKSMQIEELIKEVTTC